jgi:hypothetical protein
MDYLQLSGSLLKGNQIILEPEDWTEEQWAAFLEVFDLIEADRIVLSYFKADIYGTPKAGVE